MMPYAVKKGNAALSYSLMPKMPFTRKPSGRMKRYLVAVNEKLIDCLIFTKYT